MNLAETGKTWGVPINSPSDDMITGYGLPQEATNLLLFVQRLVETLRAIWFHTGLCMFRHALRSH